MVDKNLSKARGLNSIADPASFRGTSGRAAKQKVDVIDLTTEEEVDQVAASEEELAKEVVDKPQLKTQPDADAVEVSTEEPAPSTKEEMGDANLKPVPTQRPRAPRKLVSDPEPDEFDTQLRQIREMSIPIPLAQKLESTKINLTDLFKRAYKNHAEEVRAGEYFRGINRGRERIRLSMSEEDYRRLAKLGRSRGWNRSETVTVLFEAELATGEYTFHSV